LACLNIYQHLCDALDGRQIFGMINHPLR